MGQKSSRWESKNWKSFGNGSSGKLVKRSVTIRTAPYSEGQGQRHEPRASLFSQPSFKGKGWPSWALGPFLGIPTEGPAPPGPSNMRAEEAGGWASAVVSLPVPILRLLPPGARGLCPAGNECPLSGPGARPASGHYQGAGGPRSSAAAPRSRPRWPDVAPPPRQPEPGGGVRSRSPGI